MTILKEKLLNPSLFLGGTKGLGFHLAQQASTHSTVPIIYGTSATAMKNKTDFPAAAEFYDIDLQQAECINPFESLTYSIDYFFWIAGAFLKKPLVATTNREIAAMTHLHFTNPVRLIRDAIKQFNKPFHLVTIASCSSWRLREDETIYTALKAAQATFSRNIAVELTRDNPGSKVTLINPGGLKTVNFWKDYIIDAQNFLDPAKVAKIIWDIVTKQQIPFTEVQILRKKPVVTPNDPIVEFGARVPECLSE